MQDWITIDGTGMSLRIPQIPEGLSALVYFTKWVLLLALIFVAIRAWNNRKEVMKKPARLWRGLTAWLKRNYLLLLLPLGFAAILWATVTYLWQIPALIGDMLSLLKSEVADQSPDDIRSLAYAFAALTGTLAILATVPFQLVRIWINERTARTAEQNLTTGLINTAVEGLGAEKRISRIGRAVTVTTSQGDQSTIEWQDTPLAGGRTGDPGA